MITALQKNYRKKKSQEQWWVNHNNKHFSVSIMCHVLLSINYSLITMSHAFHIDLLSPEAWYHSGLERVQAIPFEVPHSLGGVA